MFSLNCAWCSGSCVGPPLICRWLLSLQTPPVQNNNCRCGWDGGDCCGAQHFEYCTECACLDPLAVCTGRCGLGAGFRGDGYCDDNNNNCGCDWDGGDCCGASNNYQFCVKCACADPEFTSTTSTTTTTLAPGDECVESFAAGAKCLKNAWQGDVREPLLEFGALLCARVWIVPPVKCCSA